MTTIIDWVRAHADGVPRWLPTTFVVAAAVVVLGLALYLMARAITARARRRLTVGQHAAAQKKGGFNAKLEIGFGVVQAGLSFITITGVYEFFHALLDMPQMEASVLAVFIEAAIWTSVGFIVEHGRSTVEKIKDGVTELRPATGWGLGAPFFWIFSLSAGLLAVLASEGVLIGVGRTVVVVIGTAMWVLRLMRSTRRPERRSRFRWTPYRIADAGGWIEPDPQDNPDDQNREWRVQRLAKAIRLKNSKVRLVRWWGDRSLTKLAEECTPEILRAAQERFAAAYVLRQQAAANSQLMAAVIGTVTATTVQLAQIGEQMAVAGARRSAALGAGPAEARPAPPVITGQLVPRQPDVDDDQADRTVEPIAGQFAKDQAAATTIVAIVSRLTDGTYATWDQLRDAVLDGKLLNSIERESKTTEVPMGKPRVVRILDKAHTLFEVPPKPPQEQAKSA